MIEFLNSLTGGNLLTVKVVFATIVFALAGLQVAMAARFWGAGGLPWVSEATAVAVHRWSGRVTLLLAAFVALACLVGPAGVTSPTRVLLHSVVGSAVLAVLALKFALLKLTRSGDRLLPLVGSLTFLSFAAVWATSVADYVSAR